MRTIYDLLNDEYPTVLKRWVKVEVSGEARWMLLTETKYQEMLQLSKNENALDN